MSSLSCPSEPPDVGNWFSSYEYQSPNLDSNFTLEESSSGKSRSLHKDETKTEIVQPKVCVEHNNSFDELQYSLGSTKHKETVNRNCGSPVCNGEAHCMSLDTHTSAMRPPKSGTKAWYRRSEIKS
ncbi:hypothetical protein KIW84_010369 [Lathyrus oleraceus]|uniref:Uncharacterized protein n=1 Tax=Pisum sativum TaxID=3888 RepID=A0A9D4YKQ1_PEA|nr:hypothetical protein KIW84_010369 [Pisum sativum]